MDDTTPHVDTTPDYTTPPQRPQKNIFIIVGAVVIALAAYLFFSSSPSTTYTPQDYLISGVPYYGIYTYQGGGASAIADTTEGSVAMVTDYWNTEQHHTFEELLAWLRDDAREGTFYRFDRVAAHIDELPEYNAEVVSLSVNDIGKYVNDREKTPLIASAEILRGSTLVSPVTVVVIGVSYSEGTVTVHDYWLGNNREISVDEFAALIGADAVDVPVDYLVITPEDQDAVLAEVNARSQTAYPARSEVMDAAEEMFKHYYVGAAAAFAGNYEYAIEQLNTVRNDSAYEEFFPKYFKMYTNALLAQSYLGQDLTEEATEFVETAVALNDGLDQPGAGGWLGIQSVYNDPSAIDQSHYPYVVLGDIRLENGDTAGARTAYERAHEISGGIPFTRDRLDSLQ